MSTTTETIEHIVLYKVNPQADLSKATTMVNGLNSLISLDEVRYLTAGPILLRTRSSSSSFSSSLTFTHMLHSQYKSKHHLSNYATHPKHLSVVNESKPIVQDIMALDWVTASPVSPRAGSAMRVTFFKLKENLGDKEKSEVMGVVGGIKDHFPSIDQQMSFGENFSPGRAKGFSIGSIVIFLGLRELDAAEEMMNLQWKKVGDLLESMLVVDYLIPPVPQPTSL